MVFNIAFSNHPFQHLHLCPRTHTDIHKQTFKQTHATHARTHAMPPPEVLKVLPLRVAHTASPSASNTGESGISSMSPNRRRVEVAWKVGRSCCVRRSVDRSSSGVSSPRKALMGDAAEGDGGREGEG